MKLLPNFRVNSSTMASAATKAGRSGGGELIMLVAVTSICFCLQSAAALPLRSSSGEPTPTPWPHQFHSVLFENYSGSLSTVDLWYDWTNGRKFSIIQHQLVELIYNIEWKNGSSYYYTSELPECHLVNANSGIIRPDWLDGATYLGQSHVDSFLCNVWEKADFVRYYEDIYTKRPVHWLFYTGKAVHVLTFEVGAVVEDAKWQAPIYCFEKKKDAEAEQGSRAKPTPVPTPVFDRKVRWVPGVHRNPSFWLYA